MAACTALVTNNFPCSQFGNFKKSHASLFGQTLRGDEMLISLPASLGQSEESLILGIPLKGQASDVIGRFPQSVAFPSPFPSLLQCEHT
jgi:hypothetical protein